MAFVRGLFEAIARGDWPSVAASFHPDAALFVTNPGNNMPALLSWEEGATLFKEWVEHSAGVRRFSTISDTLELQVGDRSAIVTLPSTRKVPGARVLVLVLEDQGWQVRHLHVSRLGIPLTRAD